MVLLRLWFFRGGCFKHTHTPPHTFPALSFVCFFSLRAPQISFEAAKAYAELCFERLPKHIHWRVSLELADLAKRSNKFDLARQLYRRVTSLQPHASQGWLEFSKMEEECGNLVRCQSILRQGLASCPLNEALLTKAIKHEERLGDVAQARELLSELRDVSLDKCWRTLLEGAQLEARSGHSDVARQVFGYLMENVPWYGPIYHDAFRFEERVGNERKALAIIRAGIAAIPRYGPLWFGAFRLYEALETKRVRRSRARSACVVLPIFPKTRAAFDAAIRSISRELVWKVHFEAARMEERAAELCGIVAEFLFTQSATRSGPPSPRSAAPGVTSTPAPSPPRGAAAMTTPPRHSGAGAGVIDARLNACAAQLQQVSASPPSAAMLKSLLRRSDRSSHGGGGGGGGGSGGGSGSGSGSGSEADGHDADAAVSQQPTLPHPDAMLPPHADDPTSADAALTEAELCFMRARSAFVLAALHAPVNLRWKVWLAGSRMELGAGREDVARKLLVRGLAEVPKKSRAPVMLELARLEEYSCHPDRAREVLADARLLAPYDWKVCLEGVLLERRVGRRNAAVRLAEQALQSHTGTGRLWAVLVQLRGADGPDPQMQVFSQALGQVPKSGEVWCEGARLHMNPHSPYYDTVEAARHLKFALQFTPQYGDSFIEWLRLGLLIAAGFGTHSSNDDLPAPHTELHIDPPPVVRNPVDVLNVDIQELLSTVDMSVVERRCVNADPNYGYMWFHCKVRPFDSARQVLQRAATILRREIHLCRHLYARAAQAAVARMHGSGVLEAGPASAAAGGAVEASPSSPSPSPSPSPSSSPSPSPAPLSRVEAETELDAELDMAMESHCDELEHGLEPGAAPLPPRVSTSSMTTTYVSHITGFVGLSQTLSGVSKHTFVKPTGAGAHSQRRKQLYGADNIVA